RTRRHHHPRVPDRGLPEGPQNHDLRGGDQGCDECERLTPPRIFTEAQAPAPGSFSSPKQGKANFLHFCFSHQFGRSKPQLAVFNGWPRTRTPRPFRGANRLATGGRTSRHDHPVPPTRKPPTSHRQRPPTPRLASWCPPPHPSRTHRAPPSR